MNKPWLRGMPTPPSPRYDDNNEEAERHQLSEPVDIVGRLKCTDSWRLLLSPRHPSRCATSAADKACWMCCFPAVDRRERRSAPVMYGLFSASRVATECFRRHPFVKHFSHFLFLRVSCFFLSLRHSRKRIISPRTKISHNQMRHLT